MASKRTRQKPPPLRVMLGRGLVAQAKARANDTGSEENVLAACLRKSLCISASKASYGGSANRSTSSPPHGAPVRRPARFLGNGLISSDSTLEQAERKLSKFYVGKTTPIAQVQDLVAALLTAVEKSRLLAGCSPIIAACAVARLAGEALGKPFLLPVVYGLGVYLPAVGSAVRKLQTGEEHLAEVFRVRDIYAEDMWKKKTRRSRLRKPRSPLPPSGLRSVESVRYD